MVIPSPRGLLRSAERIKSIAKEVLEKIIQERGLSENPFTCRCDLIGEESSSQKWQVTFWVNAFQGLGFELIEERELSDDIIRVQIQQCIETELERAGLES